MFSRSIGADEFLETYLVNQTMTWIDSVLNDARQPAAPSPWFCYTSMVSPHPPNWVPVGPWSTAYSGVRLPPINYKMGDIAELPFQTRMLLGLLGKEHDDPPAFPQGRPNMSFIDQPTASVLQLQLDLRNSLRSMSATIVFAIHLLTSHS